MEPDPPARPGIHSARRLSLCQPERIGELSASTADLASGNITTLSDYFGTNNQFFGGQIGAQFVLERYGFSLDVTGKVAFGTTSKSWT